MSGRALAFAAAAAGAVGGALFARQVFAPEAPAPKTSRVSPDAPADPASREADDVVDAVRRGRLSAALAGAASFLRLHDPAALDADRRAAFEEARLAAGRWGLAEAESLVGRGQAEAAEAVLARAVAVLAGTEAEAEAAACSTRVRAAVEAVAAAATAAAEQAAVESVEKILLEARAKAAVGKPADALAGLLGPLEAASHPAAKARIEKEVASLRRSVKVADGRSAQRKRADEFLAKGDYAKAREVLVALVEGAGEGTPAEEAARDKAKLDALKDLEQNREPEALAAVRRALRWMVKQQIPDGSFSVPVMGDDGKAVPDEQRKKAKYRTGITGLAAIALLGHVRHDLTDEFEPALDRSLAWIVAAQKSNGSFTGMIYEDAICTLALIEADRILKKPGMAEPATRGLVFLQDAQNSDGGWKYSARKPPSDVSVTGWALQALLHAESGGYELRPGTVDSAFGYLDRMTDPATKQTQYQVPGGGNPAMTAVALFCRLRRSMGPEDDTVRLAAEFLARHPPHSASMKRSSYATFYASDAMSRLGGSWWRKWAPSLKKTLLDAQNKKGDAEGSWPSAEDAWARNAGAVYHCAMNAMSLENFFEHRE
ncbi:MAG TPA: prenyltransferase/squalene oxidase repeat-containing protein [Planctomycetota bacterium]|nr:prenyltransferase/squalene oxidase repeat-containing protein [Planctomycetota bacterium]